MRADPAHQTTEKNTKTGIDANRRFGRQRRLPDKTAFTRVFKKAERSRDKMFTVLYRPNGTDEPRLGLAIGKKNCRLSSGRNRLKRLVRESFRNERSRLAGLDIVVLNQPAAARADNRTLFGSLENHWQRCCRKAAEEAGKN